MTPLHTVTLDGDAETLLTEHGVIVVDGTTWDGTVELGPPEWALDATQPCETCDPDRPGCSRCYYTHPVIEVQTACGNGCIRFDGKVPGHVYGSNWAWVPCQTCMGTMLISSFWTVGECLPIVAGMEGRDIDGPHFRAWTALGGATAHGVAGLPERWGDLPGDPADLVGKFALTGCEQVTS